MGAKNCSPFSDGMFNTLQEPSYQSKQKYYLPLQPIKEKEYGKNFLISCKEDQNLLEFTTLF